MEQQTRKESPVTTCLRNCIAEDSGFPGAFCCRQLFGCKACEGRIAGRTLRRVNELLGDGSLPPSFSSYFIAHPPLNFCIILSLITVLTTVFLLLRFSKFRFCTGA